MRAIADKPRMEHSASNVTLTISSCSLSLTNIETGHIIAKHDMPRISFASGGDTVKSIPIAHYFLYIFCLTVFVYLQNVTVHDKINNDHNISYVNYIILIIQY